jgi:hypothetical protein
MQIRGKTETKLKIWLNSKVRLHLRWLVNRFKCSDGILLLKSIAWDANDADVVLYCDASLDGWGFWSPTINLGMKGQLPLNPTNSIIFYYEAFAVATAFLWAVSNLDKPK